MTSNNNTVKMSNFRFGSLFLAASAIAMAVGLAGCVDENPWGNASADKGTIDITLTADFGFDTQRPVFRSDGTRVQGDADDLSTYITLPDVEDFRITLDSKDEKYHGYWESLSAFKSDVAANKEFDAGIYTITASYGDASAQGFGLPRFEASSTFTVIANRKSEVSLTAELVKSMVVVDYTGDFKAYMSKYEASLLAQGTSVSFSYDETRPAFISPGDAEITVNFTTKETKTAKVNVGTFAAVAKTLHKLTFGVEENENGFAKLTVTFDNSLEDEELEVDLTDDLYTTPAPEIMAVGFENGATYDWNSRQTIDGKSLSGLKMNVVARGGISSATLGLVGATSPWGQETIDLHTATAATLGDYGVTASNFDSNDKPVMATLDVEGLATKLAENKGEFKIYLSVTDTYGQTCDQMAVIINSNDVAISLAKEGDVSQTPDVEYGATKTEVILDYNGNDAGGLTFQTAEGAAVEVVSCESTRAFGNSRYTYTLQLPEKASISDKVSLIASQNGVSLGSFDIPVKLPDYSISEVDAFAHYAYLKVDADPSVLGLIMSNITLKSGNSDLVIADRDAVNGILTVTNLSAGTTYNLKSSIINKEPTQAETKSIATENELAIPNGDFSAQGDNLTSGELQVGGEYKVGVTYQHKSSFSYVLPSGWATVNDLTAWSGASNRNTWFVVPSSWLDVASGMGYMRNVGYNHNGSTPSSSSGAFTYYCQNAPDASDLVNAAGELFLGSYSFDGTEIRNEGIGFASRPSSVSFDYIYELSHNMVDNGYAYVELLDASGAVVGSADPVAISAGEGSIIININYGKFASPAAKLKVSFKSSNQTTPPIYIPSGSELNENQGLKTISANQYHAVATGSVLKIDNVTAHYDSAPATAQAPRRNNVKKRR